tara:strand:+ start:285 stop:482 length:198 start_codon:yes stop_codon:yes gene_type:complete
MKNRKKNRNQVNHYMYEDDFQGIDPARGIKKEKRRASRHNQKRNLKNMKDPKDWEDMEDMYDEYQ